MMNHLLSLIIFLLLTNSTLFCLENSIYFDCTIHDCDTNRSEISDTIISVPDVSPLCNTLIARKSYLKLDDSSIPYHEIEGTGKRTVLLINGGPGGTHHCFHPYFSELSDSFKVIYYDQRGCGESQSANSIFSTVQAIKDIEQLRKELGINKWVLSGFSYGAALAQLYSLAYPENTAGLVLIGGKACLPSKNISSGNQYKYTTKSEIRRINQLYDLYDKAEISYEELLFNKGISGEWRKQHYCRPTRYRSALMAKYEWVNEDGFNYIMSNDLARIDLEACFNDCPIPVLIAEGKYDRTWTEGKPVALRKNHPNAEYIEFQHSSHCPFQSEPEAFFTELNKFLVNINFADNINTAKWQASIPDNFLTEYNKMLTEWHYIKELAICIASDKPADKDIISTLRNNNYAEYYLNLLSYYYLKRKENKKALAQLIMNTKIWPASWNCWDSLGECYKIMNNKQKSYDCYKKSVELNPDNQNGIDQIIQIESELLKPTNVGR